MIHKGMRAIHPGEILLETFMKPSDPPIHATTLAKALEVPANRITAISKGSVANVLRVAKTTETYFCGKSEGMGFAVSDSGARTRILARNPVRSCSLC